MCRFDDALAAGDDTPLPLLIDRLRQAHADVLAEGAAPRHTLSDPALQLLVRVLGQRLGAQAMVCNAREEDRLESLIHLRNLIGAACDDPAPARWRAAAAWRYRRLDQLDIGDVCAKLHGYISALESRGCDTGKDPALATIAYRLMLFCPLGQVQPRELEPLREFCRIARAAAQARCVLNEIAQDRPGLDQGARVDPLA